MIMLKLKRWGLVLLLAVSMGGGLAAPIVLAQTNGQQNQTQISGQGLEISPPLVELKADPGQALTFDIKLRNVTRNNVIAKGSVNDFTAQNEESGNPKVLTDPNETTPYSIKAWVKIPEDIRIVPQQQVTQKVTIDVPKDASPGSHYGVIRFTAVPEGLDSTGVSLSASIGTLTFITVSGEAKESAKIEEFYVSQNSKKKSFFEYGPVNLSERIKNDGNIHIKPVGDVVIKNIFGKQTATLKVNDQSRSILPGTIRKFEQKTEDKKRLFGRYSATLTLLYGPSNKTLSQTIYFWVIPWKLVVIVLIGLVLLILLLRFMLKRYKRRIISKNQQNSQNNPPNQPPTSPTNTPPPNPPIQQK